MNLIILFFLVYNAPACNIIIRYLFKIIIIDVRR